MVASAVLVWVIGHCTKVAYAKVSLLTFPWMGLKSKTSSYWLRIILHASKLLHGNHSSNSDILSSLEPVIPWSHVHDSKHYTTRANTFKFILYTQEMKVLSNWPQWGTVPCGVILKLNEGSLDFLNHQIMLLLT